MDENKTNDIVQEEEQPVLEPENTNEEQAQQTEEAAEVSGEEVSAEEPSSSGSFIKKLFSRKNIKKTIAVILLVIIAGGATYGYFRYTSPESIALRCSEMVANCNFKEFVNYIAFDYQKALLYDYKTKSFLEEDEFFEEASNKYDYDITNWDEYYEAAALDSKEGFEDTWGSFDVTCKVTRVKDLSLKKAQKEYAGFILLRESTGTFNFDDVDECKEITVKVSYDTEDKGIVRFTNTVLMVKISGSWKVFDWNYYNMGK